MHSYIITGGSKGIGKALVDKLVSSHNVYSISRTNPDNFRHQNFHYFQYDLSDLDGIPKLLNQVFSQIPENSDITLINNAGILTPISFSGSQNNNEVRTNLEVNILAPILIANQFISITQGWKSQKRLVNLSSGAALSDYPGWTLYCTAKNAINRYTSCLAEEQKSAEYPVESYAIAPGVVDTQMQDQIRASSKQDFPHLDKFIQLKEQKLLASPESVAEKMLHFLERDDLLSGKYYDLRNY